jgi:hypothetical protein
VKQYATQQLQDPVTQLYTSARGAKGNETKHGFWGVLAQQAIVMLDENGGTDDNHSVVKSSGTTRTSPD